LINETKATINFQLNKVLCMGFTTGNLSVEESQIQQNIQMSIIFRFVCGINPRVSLEEETSAFGGLFLGHRFLWPLLTGRPALSAADVLYTTSSRKKKGI
jgi:hypothetical protein